MAPPSARSCPAGGGVGLPPDALYEILLRLPAKELCRLCAVCRPWCSLLSDLQFIAAHAAAHPGPLIVSGHDTSYRDEGILCEIMDLSGRVVKRIQSSEGRTGDEWVISTHSDLACVAKGTTKSCRLLNLATGELFVLPEGLSEEHMARELGLWNYRAAVAFGQVASTGEYKVLPVLDNAFFSDPYEQLCEVFTLGGCSNARWRGRKASPDLVDMRPLSRAVVDGIAYFLLNEREADQDVVRKSIASFDLGTEE